MNKPYIQPYKQLHADLNEEQRKALHDAISKIKTKKELSIFWETLGRKFFIKGREFTDALTSAKDLYLKPLREHK